jgi:hypothetical protein
VTCPATPAAIARGLLRSCCFDCIAWHGLLQARQPCSPATLQPPPPPPCSPATLLPPPCRHQDKLFPLLLHLASPDLFTYKSCSFKVSQGIRDQPTSHPHTHRKCPTLPQISHAPCWRTASASRVVCLPSRILPGRNRPAAHHSGSHALCRCKPLSPGRGAWSASASWAW